MDRSIKLPVQTVIESEARRDAIGILEVQSSSGERKIRSLKVELRELQGCRIDIIRTGNAADPSGEEGVQVLEIVNVGGVACGHVGAPDCGVQDIVDWIVATDAEVV